MRKFLHESKLLLAFFLLFTGATVMSYVDLDGGEKTVSRSPEQILNATHPENSILLISDPLKRTPAAVSAPQKTEVLKVELFCPNAERARFKKASQSLVMLKLTVCEELKSSRHLWIKNATNGFKAQVFRTGEISFSTDFIQLNAGSNKLIIEAVLKDGQKRVRSLEIISGS